MAMAKSGNVANALSLSTIDTFPEYWLVRDEDRRDGVQWWKHGRPLAQGSPPPSEEELLKHCIAVTTTWGKCIVAGINRYYSRQILEPAIRGFLSILAREFPRADLYLYELLQNAVDDGAMHVSFSTQGKGLHFCHNGKSFSATDVLGLASVGLSTKSKGKRTIGFMGIGFKAVYKRFRTVKVFDSTFAFKFQEPERPSPMVPPHGWVLQPEPIDRKELPSVPLEQDRWCHFELAGTRGNALAAKDLSYISRSVPALLGRQAILNAMAEGRAGSAPTFVLEWGSIIYEVSIVPNTENTRHATGRSSECCEVVERNVRNNTKSKSTYYFVSTEYVPDAAARSSYKDHTRRLHSGNKESTALFFEMGPGSDLNKREVVRRGGGKVHAVLPVHGVHMNTVFNFQGPWLLSVDRQQMQSLTDNGWNACILRQTSELLCGVAEWIAATAATSAYCLFPPMTLGEKGELSTELLGQTQSLVSLETFLKRAPVIPVIQQGKEEGSTPSLAFVPSSQAIWWPPAFVKRLPIYFLRNFGGQRNPFAAAHLGCSGAYLTMWRKVIPGLQSRTIAASPSFSACGSNPISLAISCLAAYVASLQDEQNMPVSKTEDRRAGASNPDAKGGQKPSGNKDYANFKNGAATEWLPSILDFPFFLPEGGDRGHLLKNVILPSDEFAQLPDNIATLLLPALALGPSKESSSPKVKPYGNPRSDSYSAVSPLHSGLIRIMREQTTDDERLACKGLEIAREAAPTSVMGVDAALKALHAQWASLPEMSDELIQHAIAVFQWACSEGRPLSHLLCDKFTGQHKLQMVPSHKLSIGKAYLPDTHMSDISTLVKVPLVSDKYIEGLSSGHVCAKYTRFLVSCGAHRGISFEAISRRVARKELESMDLKLRSSNTSVILSLPYKLGIITKKYADVVDVGLTEEWKNIIAKSSSMIKSATAVAIMICDAIGDADTAETPTPATTPSAARLLQGKAESEDTVSHLPAGAVPSGTPVPVKSRAFFLPPGQPGASTKIVGDALWCQYLAISRWVPAAVPGSDPSAPATLVLRPAEVGLAGCANDMPQVRLPMRSLTKLAIIGDGCLKWGTKKPPPPVDELEEIAMELASFSPGRCEHPGYHPRLVSIWKALGMALSEGRLSARDQKRVATAVRQSPLVPKVEEEEDGGRGWLYSRDFLVDLSKETRAREGRLAASSLSTVKFVMDISKLDSSLKSLLCVPGGLTINAAKAYVLHCKEASPQVTAELGSAFSHALWTVIGQTLPHLDVVSRRGLNAHEKKMCSDVVTRFFPDGITVFCQRGPGLQGWRARWLPVSGSSDGVLPVLMDETPPTPSGILKKSLMTRKQMFQPLGMLSTTGRSDEHAINRVLVEALGISKVSTFKLRVQTKGARQEMTAASKRLAVVTNLLQCLHEVYDNTKRVAPSLSKFEEIKLSFSTPRVDTDVASTFAVWGGSSKNGASRPLFIAGDPDDYMADLEELLMSTYGRPIHSSTSKAIRLLAYLEDGVKFHKFLNRDFGALLEKKSEEYDSDVKDDAFGSIKASIDDLMPEPVPVVPCSPIPQPIPSVQVAGAGRGNVVNLPSWMTDPERAPTQKGPTTDSLPLQGDVKVKDIPLQLSGTPQQEQQQHQQDVLPPAKAGACGAGRGVSNLPAWMTDSAPAPPETVRNSVPSLAEPVVDIASKYNPPSRGEDSESGLPSSTQPQEAGRGAGRGVSNLPAWMMSSDTLPTAPSLSERVAGVAATYSQPPPMDKSLSTAAGGKRLYGELNSGTYGDESGNGVEEGEITESMETGAAELKEFLDQEDEHLSKAVREIVQSQADFQDALKAAVERSGWKGKKDRKNGRDKSQRKEVSHYESSEPRAKKRK